MAETAELEPKDGPSKLALMAPYRYDLAPLPTTRGHTRVLVLQPGPKDDNEVPLAGSLKLVDLRDADSEPFKFEAISYVWGPNEKTHVILVDGQILRITAHLRDALLQTRLPNRSRRIWADGICIDQSDNTEKGHQVAAMGRIYKTSQRTLICLGWKDPENAQHAAGLVDMVNLMIQNVQEDRNFSRAAGSFPFPADNDTILSDPCWELGWNVMLSHPWFDRGWVVQEASLGPDASVLWASVQIRWVSILRVDCWLYNRGYSSVAQLQGGEYPIRLVSHHYYSFARRYPEEIRLFDKDLWISPWASTLVTLFNARYLKLSDPRDRIYAFMALGTSDGILADLQLDPDYTRPFLEIYHDFAVNYLEKTGNLDILLFIRHWKESLAGPTTTALAIPSWVPRWDLEPDVIRPPTVEMVDHPEAFKIAEKGSVLRVRGLILGSVEYAATQEPFCAHEQRSLVLQNVISLWKEVVAIVAASSMNGGPYHGRQGFAFFDVLCPFMQDVWTFEEWSTGRQDFARHLQSYIPGPERESTIWISQSSETGTEQYSLKALAEEIRVRGPRRFVMLSRGYYGVAPPITQKGDLFALIHGAKSLLILRPVEGKLGYYQIVGPVYVESKAVRWPHGSNMMGREGCRDWEEWDLTEQEINLC